MPHAPPYQLLGDELDGTSGRIHLVNQVLEGGEVTQSTQQHLHRCLTCCNCETTCPSGVEYGKLLGIGRNIVEEWVERPILERVMRTALKDGLSSPLFAPAMKVGQLVRPLLPQALKNKVPKAASARSRQWPTREHARKIGARHSGSPVRRQTGWPVVRS